MFSLILDLDPDLDIDLHLHWFHEYDLIYDLNNPKFKLFKGLGLSPEQFQSIHRQPNLISQRNLSTVNLSNPQ